MNKQTIQDGEYSFPYHYVSSFGTSGFCPFYFDDWAINYVSTIEFLLDRISRDLPSVILDVGCGDGRFSRELALAFPRIKVVGVDYSQKAIALAKAMNQDVSSLEFRCLNIVDEKSDLVADALILMEVFEHIPPESAGDFISALRGLIKPGGAIYLTVPHSNKPIEYKHFRHFDIASVSAEFSDLFEIVDVVPFEKKSWLRYFLSALLCNRFFLLNNKRLLNALFFIYKKYLIGCNGESDCQRLYMKLVAK